MAKKKFAKEIFVQWEQPENDEPYMFVHLHPADAAILNDVIEVGVYKLVRVDKVSTQIKVS